MPCINQSFRMISPQLDYTHTILLLIAGSKICFTFVTNITLFGLAMVNWGIGLLNPGVDNSYCGISSYTGPNSW